MKMNYLCLQATREGQASHAHVHEIVKGLRKRGWEVKLFEPSYASEGNSLPGPLGRLMEFIRVQTGLVSKGNRADALYVRSHFAAFPASMLAKLKGLKVVQEVNGPYDDVFIAWPFTRRFAPLFKWLMRTQLKWADAVITVTPQLRDWVISEVGQKPVYVVPNGANTEVFHPEAVCKHQVPEHYTVFFGNLAAWQGIDTLLKAVELPEWPADLHLVVIGDGAERARVEAMAAKKSNVKYLGRLLYREVPGVVAGAQIGFSPQNNIEGRSSTGLSPLKVYETLACGTPVIVSDFPGQADLVREERVGLVVPPEDPKALAEAVAALFNSPQERQEMGHRGAAIIEREHSWDQRADSTSKILLEMTGMKTSH